MLKFFSDRAIAAGAAAAVMLVGILLLGYLWSLFLGLDPTKPAAVFGAWWELAEPEGDALLFWWLSLGPVVGIYSATFHIYRKTMSWRRDDDRDQCEQCGRRIKPGDSYYPGR